MPLITDKRIFGIRKMSLTYLVGYSALIVGINHFFATENLMHILEKTLVIVTKYTKLLVTYT